MLPSIVFRPAPRAASSADHAFWVGNTAPMLGDIEEFITGQRESAAGDLERVLATVLFTDIVDSTRRAAERGDQ